MVNSRNKGKDFENKVSQLIRLRNFEARRGQQYEGSSDSPDVVSNLPFGIECKAVENLNVQKAYEQSLKDAHEDEIPIVVHKKKNKEILVSLSFKEFLDIIKFIELSGGLDEFTRYIESGERRARREHESERLSKGEARLYKRGCKGADIL